MANQLTVTGIQGIPLVAAGDDLADIIIKALDAQGHQLITNDVVVVAQKIVSKAEGRQLDLSTVEPGGIAYQLTAETGKAPQHIQAILNESADVVRHKMGVIVVEHRLGHILANAGIDRSNVTADDNEDVVLLLPGDPDTSAAELKKRFDAHWQADVGVIVADSVGRAWRIGTVGIAIGVAGVAAVLDRRGEPDLFDRPLEATITGHADAIAAAATLVMGEGAEAIPAAVVRGAQRGTPGTAQSINRPKSEDMFR